ncbi:MAG: hypothetical protein MMC23_000433 [Stictis urceolatum]|nr:hypothetical protein [Stictis urceolata]
MEQALLQLSETWRDWAFWIDAICINQHNVSEKNDRVSRLRTIYEKAALVVAWLGPGHDDCSRALERLNDLDHSMLSKYSLKELVVGTQYDQLRDIVDRAKFGYRRECHVEFLSTIALLFREFWNRIWVTQELMLAQKLSFHCGEQIVSRKEFLAAYYVVSYCCMRHCLDSNDEHRWEWQLMSKALSKSRFLVAIIFENKWSARDTFHSLFTLARESMLASDPRDIIYALLGISSDREQIALDPDYRRSVVEVYTDALQAVIGTGDLDIIFEAQEEPSERLQNLPSWVPDFSCPSMTVPIAADVESRLKWNAIPFCASWHWPSHPPKSPGHRPAALRVSGIRIDTVTYIGRMWRKELGSSIPALNDWMDHVIDLLGQCRRDKDDKQQHDTAMWLTPIAGTKIDRSDSKLVRMQESLLADYRALREKRDCSESLLTGANEYRDLVNEFSHMRRLFMCGSRVGLGPQALQKGDVVCLLFGASVPYAVRELQDGDFKLVGDVYIDGIMYGELSYDGYQPETFVLI